MPGSPIERSTAPVPLPIAITRAFLLHHRVCPKAIADDGALIIAVAENARTSALADIAAVYQRPFAVEQTPGTEVERLIERLATPSNSATPSPQNTAEEATTTADVRDLATQPPVIRYVNLLVRDACDAHASDIHLDATPTGLTTRFRIDGKLTAATEPPTSLAAAIISRLKLLADLDIAERRRPQDGRIRVRLETHELDLRISTIPTMFGESVVLRILDHGGRPVSLDALGMSTETLAAVSDLSSRPHGMVLVTGPTGSGKTTTLYAALHRRQVTTEKIITIEDPIEYRLDGITQMPVLRQTGVTFASALRAILRQDPDVLMVGEMRDAETAQIATQAAMTGHLVFSTLHTNDAVGAIPRLLDLGVADYLVAVTLDGILAQRLVRRTCDACRIAYQPAPGLLRTVGAPDADSRPQLTHGAGCPRCRGTGYRGRIGLFELLVLNDALRDAIASHAPRAQLRTLADRAGMTTLRADGWAKITAGLTTVDEVARAVSA